MEKRILKIVLSLKYNLEKLCNAEIHDFQLSTCDRDSIPHDSKLKKLVVLNTGKSSWDFPCT